MSAEALNRVGNVGCRRLMAEVLTSGAEGAVTGVGSSCLAVPNGVGVSGLVLVRKYCCFGGLTCDRVCS